MRLLYFAWIRQQTGIGEEEVPLPTGISDVSGLIEWLRERDANFSTALEDISALRVAVNQEFATFDTKITDRDEVALFPPMTGG
ncbi:MAG: molybdopterin converting factor subunit 1 [Rhodospirillaceae bacterium]|nr:molybdopterin converting factor subunit 1 [Rhodospirillaceae bacterium]|tara:strand:+ start:1676 stop:1927 length:252 start_codon:yes stop_codon:yes gene_type:complete